MVLLCAAWAWREGLAPWMFFNSLSRSAPGEFLRVGEEKGLQRGERGVWVRHLYQRSSFSLELLRERLLWCFSPPLPAFFLQQRNCRGDSASYVFLHPLPCVLRVGAFLI